MKQAIAIVAWSILLCYGIGFSDCSISAAPVSFPSDTVSFSLVCTNSETPEVSWKFGDSDSLTAYSSNLTASHPYAVPGIYNVFARVKGQLLPYSLIHRVIYKPTS